MATIGGKFVNDSGVTEVEGALVTDQPLNADTIGGVAINNTPSGAGEVLETVDPSNAHWTAPSGGGSPDQVVYALSGVNLETMNPYDIAAVGALSDMAGNPLMALPADMGLTNTAGVLEATENGVWGLTLGYQASADVTWAANVALNDNVMTDVPVVLDGNFHYFTTVVYKTTTQTFEPYIDVRTSATASPYVPFVAVWITRIV